LHSLTQQLHTEGPGIVNSLSSVDHLIGSVGGLFSELENHNLPGDISDVASVAGVLAQHTDTLGTLIEGFDQAFGDFARVSQNGNWVNVYPCNLSIITYGTVSISAADGIATLKDLIGGNLGALLKSLGLSTASLAALATPTPLRLPNGYVGHSTQHTQVCS
jgi:ABC-type transporter Mla subunit MlaD